MSEARPRVGVIVAVQKDDKFLFAKRKNVVGHGWYAMPGGHLEPYESFADCARREVLEETGIEVEEPSFLLLGNEPGFKEYSFVCIGMLAKWKSGEPKNLEPEKSEDWQWYALDEFPTPYMPSTKYVFEALKTGKHFFDA